MDDGDDQQACARARVSRALALCVMALAALVLIGWALRIPLLKSVVPGYVAMNPLTAVNFMLLATGLLAAAARSRWACIAGALVAALAALKLSEHAFSWPLLGLDQQLFRADLHHLHELPNRMAPNTGVSQMLLGLALASLGIGLRRVWISEVFAVLAGFNGFYALVGYGYGLHTFYRVGLFIPMAVHTAAALFLTTWSLLLARAEHGVASLLFSPSVAGVMARRFLPAALFLPPLLGWLRLLGERRGFYPSDVGVALFAVAITLVFLTMVFLTAGSLQRLDFLRRRAQEQLEEVAKRLSRSNEEIERLATTDGLTGVLNRRAWLERSAVEVAASLRYGSPLSVLMVDADHFKSINDSHGHAAGDRALCAMAQCLTAELRAVDLVGRFGGEEFCVLLRHTDLRGALLVAERCCASVRNLEILSAGGARVQLRCSIGVAELANGLKTSQELLQAADDALFVAKVVRNCVRCASSAPAAKMLGTNE